jgi:hypothetical protein
MLPPALTPVLHPRIDVNRAIAPHDFRRTLGHMIIRFNADQCSTPSNPFGIILGFLLWNPEVGVGAMDATGGCSDPCTGQRCGQRPSGNHGANAGNGKR